MVPLDGGLVAKITTFVDSKDAQKQKEAELKSLCVKKFKDLLSEVNSLKIMKYLEEHYTSTTISIFKKGKEDAVQISKSSSDAYYAVRVKGDVNSEFAPLLGSSSQIDYNFLTSIHFVVGKEEMHWDKNIDSLDNFVSMALDTALHASILDYAPYYAPKGSE